MKKLGNPAALAVLVSATLATTATVAVRAAGSPGAFGMMPITPGLKTQAALSLGTVSPAITIGSAGYGTGGVGLRNRASGTLAVSGVVPPTKAAYLYWGVITQGPPTAANGAVAIQRISFPGSPDDIVTGAVVGTGPQPCWIGDRITIYRAAVPLNVANGNGEFRVKLKSGASGLINGADPWAVAPVLPLMEGASLVIVGAGNSTVALYDKGLAGQTFNSGLTYALKLPVKASGGGALFDNVGADGQKGASRSPFVAQENTSINGVKVAGAGAPDTDSDWNGSSALPLPQLWDDTGHNILAAAPAGTTTLNFSITEGSDCLSPVANVVSIR